LAGEKGGDDQGAENMERDFHGVLRVGHPLMETGMENLDLAKEFKGNDLMNKTILKEEDAYEQSQG
jgi:hypothetical protein